MICSKNNISYLVLILAVVLTGCSQDDDLMDQDPANKLLVEGYVFAGERVRIFKVSRLNENGNSEPVATANIVIEQNGSSISLIPKPDTLGVYEQADTTHFIDTSGSIALEVSHNGFNHTSSTAMLNQPQNVTLSSQKITLSPGNNENIVAELSWDEVQGASGYCIFLRNLGENDYPVGTYVPNSNAAGNPFRIVNQDTDIELKSGDFSHYGDYELYVTAINEEYADMYSNDGSFSLTSAPSNIENGWGVFTAFNGVGINVVVE
jgi:hypothetical protein